MAHPVKGGSAFKICKTLSPCWHVFWKHVYSFTMHTICIAVGTENCKNGVHNGKDSKVPPPFRKADLKLTNFLGSNRHIQLLGIVDEHCDIHS